MAGAESEALGPEILPIEHDVIVWYSYVMYNTLLYIVEDPICHFVYDLHIKYRLVA